MNFDEKMNPVRGREFVLDGQKQQLPEIMAKKPFSQTALGRTLSGKNRTGRILHSILDVLPVPSVHEVARRVIRDEEKSGQALSLSQVLLETARRLDWLRTAGAVLAALLIVKGASWLGVAVSDVIQVLAEIVSLMAGGA